MLLNYADFDFGLQKMNAFRPGNSEMRADRKEEQLSPKETHYRKPTVLVFGTDRDSRFLLKTILELWNYETFEAETVEQAIFTAKLHCPDLILMETQLSLPDSFSKMHMMRKSFHLQKVPFVLISGHAQEDARLMALAAGASEFFVKPVNLDRLENTLTMCLSGKDTKNKAEDCQ